MVNHTSSMLGVMGFGASAASPAPAAPAPKAHLLENFTHFQTNRKTGMCTRFQSRTRFAAPEDAILDGLFQQARCHAPLGAPRMAFWLGSRCWCMALRNTGKPMRSSILHRKMHWPAEQQCRESQVSHTRQVSRDGILLLGDVIRVPHPPRLLLVHEFLTMRTRMRTRMATRTGSPRSLRLMRKRKRKKRRIRRRSKR